MEKEANKWVTLNRGDYLVNINNEIYKIGIGDGKNITINDVAYKIDFRKIKDDVFTLDLFSSSFEIIISDFYTSIPSTTSTKLTSKLRINVNGSQIQAIVDDQRSLVAQSWLLRKPHISKSVAIRAPMPGLITKVLVQQGMTVPMGNVLLVLEAMKMENEIRALQECKIESVCVHSGSTVERNDELLKIVEI
jgi:biotin carboxyl carrier protein